MAKDRLEASSIHSSDAPGESVDALTKLALLKMLEPKPPQKDSGNWLGIPKAVLISGFGTLVVALFNWFLSIQTEKAKLSNDLIKLAVAADDQEQAARNLRFLARLELISVKEDQLATVLEDPASRPLFTSGDKGPAYRVGDDGMVEFEDDWVAKNIVSVEIPQLVGVKTLGSDKPFPGTVRLSREAMLAARAAFAEIETAGLKSRILSFDGGFFPRLVRGGARLSNHALGNSFDINCRWNAYGKPAVEIGNEGSVKELVPIFEKHGFKWGGTFARPDACHFEFRPQHTERPAAP